MTTAFFDQAPCGFFAFREDGTLHTVNETLCALLGYGREELEGKNVETLFTLPTRIFYQTHFFPLVKMQGRADEIFLSLQTKEKQHLPVLLNAQRTTVDNSTYISCAFIVVHHRKKFEEELIAARKAAETALRENSDLVKVQSELQRHAEQLDIQMQVANRQNHELKQLNRVVTHDLREPLRKMLVYTERLQSNLPSPMASENLYGDFKKLAKAAAQMQAMVSGLQQYMWLDDAAGTFRKVDLNGVLKKVLEKLQQEWGPDQWTLRADHLPALEADPKQMELLLYHILANAVKFKKGEKASITITAITIQRNRFVAVEDRYKYEDFLKLTIRDEGMGFDPAFRQDVFELFKRMHYAEGKGLGLALCKKIVDNHGGIITANSRIHEYTAITVILPLVPAPKQS